MRFIKIIATILFTLLLFLPVSAEIGEEIIIIDADTVWNSDLTLASSDVTDSTDTPLENLIKYAFVSHADSVWHSELTPASSDVTDSTDALPENLITWAFVSHADTVWNAVLEKEEWETKPDLSILEPIEFFNNEPPFLPNVLKIRATVINEGETKAENVVVKFTLSGELLGEESLGTINPKEQKLATIKWEANSNVENATITVEAIASGQEDDLFITQPLSFYWVDFRYNRDAFKFSNTVDWQYSYFDELETVLKNNGIIGPARVLFGGFILSYSDSKDGHCYGMASASTHWYIIPQDKPRQIDTFEMSLEQEDVKANIINHHWAQLLYKVQFLHNVLINYEPQEHYDSILQDIKSGFPAVISLGKAGIIKGHAVTAYNILDLSDEKQVYVYDNEVPLKNKPDDTFDPYATFKLSSNEAKFDAFDRVMHVPIEYALYPDSFTSPSDFANAIKRAIKQLWDGRKMFFWEHSPTDPLVTDEFGRRTGYVGDTLYNEIPGAEVKQISGTYLFYLPLEFTYSIEMIGTDTGHVGVDFVIPISESQAEVVNYKDIPVILGSQISANINPTNLTYQIISETGEIITPDDKGKLDASFVTSAKWLKEKTRDRLEKVKTTDKKIDNKISNVIKNITESLKDNFWQNEIYLDPKKGKKVFRYEMMAVAKMKLYLYLSEYSNYHKLPENVAVVFEQAIKDLVATDEILAQVILNEAKNTQANNPKYQKEVDILIAKAEQNIEQANQYSADNNPARTVFKYSSSWYFSQKAIKYANKN